MKYILILLALCFALQTFSQEEVKIAMQLVEEYTQPEDLDLSEATTFYKAKDYKNAQKVLDKFKKTYPNHEDILLFEGKILMDR